MQQLYPCNRHRYKLYHNRTLYFDKNIHLLCLPKAKMKMKSASIAAYRSTTSTPYALPAAMKLRPLLSISMQRKLRGLQCFLLSVAFMTAIGRSRNLRIICLDLCRSFEVTEMIYRIEGGNGGFMQVVFISLTEQFFNSVVT
ncbi:hypothetical protein VTL71DRAFT_6618 [Oculimacula yallundae]|uniref:Uncharacterized protein n=1 Tax=Oculimacula yallundae TaxID=86028 RepID=A0ABR4BY54_9HELO